MDDWQRHRRQLQARLRRVEGQVRAVADRMDEAADCEALTHQLSAARRALDRAFFEMMACMTRRELSASGLKDRKALKRLHQMADLLARYA